MKTKDIAGKTSSEINKLIAEKREELRVFRFGGAGAKVKNVKAGASIRRDIARLMTALSAQKSGAKAA